jgi:hypothetical protein
VTSSQDPSPADDPHGHEGQWSPPPAYPQTPQRQSTQILSIIGFVGAAVSVFFIPILFGLVGIVLGIVGHTRGEPLGKWAAVASGICMIVGMLLGALATRALRS